MKDVKPLDLDGILGVPKNRVARVGIELEGAWSTVPLGAHVERDASVFKDLGDDGTTGRTLLPGYKVGEIPIGKIQPAQVLQALKKYYPQKTDKSCGMHVHLGFADVHHYSLLMEPEYQASVIEYLKRWAKEEGFEAKDEIFKRLDGKSEYAQDKFWPDEQIRNNRKDYDRARKGHRYTIINYCWGRYKTVECRVLPMMATPEQAYRAIKVLLDVTNACLVKIAKREKISLKVTVVDTDPYEEYLEGRL